MSNAGNVGIRIDFNPNAVKARLSAKMETVQAALDIQVLKDSNYYIPNAEGTLERSGVISSGGGEVAWETVYARKQYHEFPNKSKDKNPNASTKWFERAKATKLKEWEALANREYSK